MFKKICKLLIRLLILISASTCIACSNLGPILPENEDAGALSITHVKGYDPL